MDDEVTLQPVYEFRWPDGTTLRTDNLENRNNCDFGKEGVQFLTELVAYHNPEVEIEKVGYEA